MKPDQQLSVVRNEKLQIENYRGNCDSHSHQERYDPGVAIFTPQPADQIIVASPVPTNAKRAPGRPPKAASVATKPRKRGRPPSKKVTSLSSHGLTASSRHGRNASKIKSGGKREGRRAGEACTHCRGRKQKCTEGQPCDLCVKERKECLYESTLTPLQKHNLDKIRQAKAKRSSNKSGCKDRRPVQTAQVSPVTPTKTCAKRSVKRPPRYVQSPSPTEEESEEEEEEVHCSSVIASESPTAHARRSSEEPSSVAEAELLTSHNESRKHIISADAVTGMELATEEHGKQSASPFFVTIPGFARMRVKPGQMKELEKSNKQPKGDGGIFHFDAFLSSGSVMEFDSTSTEALSVAPGDFTWYSDKALQPDEDLAIV